MEEISSGNKTNIALGIFLDTQNTDKAGSGQPTPQASNDHDSTIDIMSMNCPAALFTKNGRLIKENASFRAEFEQLLSSKNTSEYFFHNITRLRTHFDLTNNQLTSNELLAKNPHVEDAYCVQTQSNYQFIWLQTPSNQQTNVLLLAINSSQRVALQKRQRAMYDTSRKMSVGEMVTTLAHELNQPLAALSNYLHIAKQHCETKPANLEVIREALARALKQSNQASLVISRIREFIQNNKPLTQSVAIADLIEEVLDLLSFERQSHQIKTDLNIALGLPPIIVDPIMITQVLNNLIRNAIDAMHSAPVNNRLLTIEADLDAESRIRVKVIDRGHGIKPENLSQVFRPFFTTKIQSGGMGAGLSICRSIVEYHGGNLYFENNAELNPNNNGATFVFTLPTQ